MSPSSLNRRAPAGVTGRLSPARPSARLSARPSPRRVALSLVVGLLMLAVALHPALAENVKVYPIKAVSTVLSLNVLRQAAAAYSVQHPGFELSAVSFPSSAGVVSAFLTGAYDLVLSTAPLSPVQRVAYPQYKEFPIMASAVAPIYNLPASAGTAQLVMPLQVICDIERGIVTNWNDTRLQAANPQLVMPDLGITVFHLSIASSSSEMIAALCGKSVPPRACAHACESLPLVLDS
jgi:ABC-type phosphate transport system substrate-binding protein